MATVVAAALVALGLLAMLCHQEEPTAPTPRELQVSEDVTRSSEEWVRMAKEASKGVIRVETEVGQSHDEVILTKGPLSAVGEEQVRAFIDGQIARIQVSLDKASAEPHDSVKPSDRTRRMASDLRLLAKLYILLVMKDQLRDGNYITLAEGSVIPRRTGGSKDFTISPVGIKSGGFGIAYFVVEPSKHEKIKELYQAIEEMTSVDRDERIFEFNTRSIAERLTWLERYQDLTGRVAKGGIGALSTTDIDEYWEMQALVRYLRVEPDMATSTWRQRQ